MSERNTAAFSGFRRFASVPLFVLTLILVACGDATSTPASTTAATPSPVSATSTAAATTAAVATTAPATTAGSTQATTAPASPTTIPAATTAAPSTTAANPAATPDPNAKTGGTLTVGYKSDYDTLDPALGYTAFDWPVEHIVFNALLNYDSGTTLIPDLATSLPTVSADGKTFTFTLKKGVTFSNGREVKAVDFKYSWERLFDPALQSPFTGFWSVVSGAPEYADSLSKNDGKVKEITGIKVIDDYTLSVTLANPDQSFLNIIAMPEGSVVPKEEVEKWWDKDHKTNDFSHHIVGTGPYILKEWKPGTSATLVKNPTYNAGGNAGYVSEIDVQFGLDESTQVLRVKKNQLDIMADTIPSADYVSLINDATYKDQVISAADINTQYVFMNTQMAPFDNVKVRQAFEDIFNKQRILQLINNRGIIAKGIQPKGMPGYNPDLDTGYTYDPAKAKSLLQAAGFDFNQTLTLWARDVDDARKVAQELVAEMKAIGIKAETKIEPDAVIFKDWSKPKTAQMGFIGWGEDFPDPSDFISPILSCSSAVENGSNNAFYCNKDVDALELVARGEPDHAKRLSAYQDIEKKIMADAPWIPLHHLTRTYVHSATVGNVSYHPVWVFTFETFYKKS